jgi:hypothetical protein
MTTIVAGLLEDPDSENREAQLLPDVDMTEYMVFRDAGISTSKVDASAESAVTRTALESGIFQCGNGCWKENGEVISTAQKKKIDKIQAKLLWK